MQSLAHSLLLDYDFMAQTHRAGDVFCVHNDYDPWPYSRRSIATAQRELMKTGMTYVARHNVWCDLTELRDTMVIDADRGVYCGSYNIVHLFNYMSMNPVDQMGAARMDAFMELIPWLLVLYHELRHAFNTRAMLRYHGNVGYETYALDELMAFGAEWLALMANCPVQYATRMAVDVHYDLPGIKNPTDVTILADSMMQYAVDKLYGDERYRDLWHMAEYRNFSNHTRPRPNVRLVDVWDEIQTFVINGQPINLMRGCNAKIRQRAMDIIYSR